MSDGQAGLVDRALRAYVGRWARRQGVAGVVVWVPLEEGPERGPVVLGQAGVEELEGVAWAVDAAYRWSGQGWLADRRRLSGLRVVAHRWAAQARAHARAKVD